MSPATTNFTLDSAYAYATKYAADYNELCDLIGSACAVLRAENEGLKQQLEDEKQARKTWENEAERRSDRYTKDVAALQQQLAQRVPDGSKLVRTDALKLALDFAVPAMERDRDSPSNSAWMVEAADRNINAVRAMLAAAPAQPEQPAAPAGTPAAFPWPLKTDRPAAQDEPVMIYHGRCIIDCGEHGHQDVEMLKMIPAGTKLYTRQQPASKPMTLDQAAEIAKQLGWDSMPGSFPLIVRAVERFHNIRE